MARSHGVALQIGGQAYTLKLWAKNRTHGMVSVAELWTSAGTPVGRVEAHRVRDVDSVSQSVVRAHLEHDEESCYAVAQYLLEMAH